MLLYKLAFLSLALASSPFLDPGKPREPLGPGPWTLAHRGASGIYPEHTEAAYQEAIASGADFIE